MINLNQLKTLKTEIACLLLGAILVLAFAPFQLWFLSFIVLPLFLHATLEASPKQAFWRGLLFGIGFFGFGISWVFISIHTYGNANLVLASLITFLFVFILALLIALKMLLVTHARRYTSLSYVAVVLFPISSIGFEWLQSNLFTGFPWLLLGYSQVTSPYSGFAPIIGVYGIGFFIALSSGLLYLTTKSIKKPTVLIGVACLILSFIIGHILTQHRWTQAIKQQTVSLVQGDISQTIKWDPNAVADILDTYYQLTNTHWADLVIWPENAVPVFPETAEPFLDDMANLAKSHQSAILTGVPFVTDDSLYYNGAMVIGDGHGNYYKRHLVPFGEYTPLLNYFGRLLQFLNIPMSDFSKGPAQQALLTMHQFKVALYICYEIAYENEVRDTLQDANLIVTISDDSWFGHSLGAYQQAEIAQMRALETGRYVINASNDGITNIIAPDGKVLAEAPRYEATVISGKIEEMTGNTPFLKYGNWPLLICCLLLLVIGVGRRNLPYPLFKRGRPQSCQR